MKDVKNARPAREESARLQPLLEAAGRARDTVQQFRSSVRQLSESCRQLSTELDNLRQALQPTTPAT